MKLGKGFRAAPVIAIFEAEFFEEIPRLDGEGEPILDENGNPVVDIVVNTVEIQRVVPEGLLAHANVHALQALAGAQPILWLVPGDVDVPPANRPVPADVPKRADLPADHPLYNLRILPYTLAGCGDLAIDDDGYVTTVDPLTGGPVGDVPPDPGE